MDWISKIIGIIAGILAILDLFMKYNISTINYGTFFIKPLFPVNLLEIIILSTVVLFLIFKVFTKKFLLQVRSTNFLKNWYKFKRILEEYNSISNSPSEEKLDKLKYEYIDIRERLETDFNFFVSKIKEIQSKTHRECNDISIMNFEHCFSVRNIEDWEEQVRRIIPKELDCFDYLLISLKENYKNN